MEKDLNIKSYANGRGKRLGIVRLCLVLFLAMPPVATASTNAQPKVSMSMKNATLESVIKELKAQTGLSFFYSVDKVRTETKSVNVRNASLDEVLRQVLAGTNLTYTIIEDVVVIKDKTEEQQQPRKTITITGVVTDEKGDKLIGAAVTAKSSIYIGTVTDANGAYTLQTEDPEDTLVFSYLGKEPQEVKLQPGRTTYNVAMKPSESTNINEIVVSAGIVEFDKLGFTGSYTSVTGEELRAVGNQNLIQSLQAIDPAFLVVEDNLAGSDPNSTANIQVRGQSGVTINNVQDEYGSASSSLPLFILNGFEVNVRQVSDLDMNRVVSVTVLKDAGSTAIYGSRAANGVIIIETLKPKKGDMEIYFTTDNTLSWADLSSYNLMNAEEKLEFERLSGRFSDPGNYYPGSYENQLQAYYKRLQWVREGVDTYWLAEPVQTGITTNNSLTISRGTEQIMFVANVSYLYKQGVMKGSDRSAWGGNFDFTYNLDKVKIYNRLSVSQANFNNSPYGDFSDWAKASPYFRMRDEYGNVNKYLQLAEEGINGDVNTPNPLYNAQLASKDKGSEFSLSNNLGVVWEIAEGLRAEGILSLTKEVDKKDKYKNPDHTDYDNTIRTEKGEYTSGFDSRWKYDGSIKLTYSKTFDYSHNFSVTGRANIMENNGTSEEYVAVGFPLGVNGFPNFADSYKPSSRPKYSETIKREAGFLLALSYNYQYRFLLDATYRLDGATTFGSNEKFQSFWSVGLGWNINREKFMEDVAWIDQLKLRGSIGTSGNQNVGNMSTISNYGFYSGSTIFGQGVYMSSFGNPDLRWQKARKTTVGIDLGMFKNRLTLNFDVFNDKIDPLSVNLSQKPSAGTTQYPVNIGHKTLKGFEFRLGVTPVRNTERGIRWTINVTGLHSTSKYGGTGSALDELNQANFNSGNLASNLLRYMDGYSEDDLWAVRSAGIDPATGYEVYVDKSGNPTFVYNSADIVKVGSTRADLEGFISTTFSYKKFSAYVGLKYSFGGQMMNTALFNKVENISFDDVKWNQDKRALHDRWQKPGDKAKFKKIERMANDAVPMVSSRFIQDNNFITGQTVRLTWDFSQDKWISKAGLKGLKANLYMNDFMRLSSIKAERGTSYPFSRAISLGLNATF
ncbi:SusC/RagA family TonB-linked outer membrane protein [Alistipes sp. OttesenSCG-928-B03]|nr:SusC/RagA family TonB-linked outer membrane protein [Alistipes sp. OttesenSCG-928-B03]